MKDTDALSIGGKPAPGELVFVQGFVNTTDIESGRDDFSTTEGVRSWLVRHGLLDEAAAVSEEERSRTIALREAVRRLLLANNGDTIEDASAEIALLSTRAPLILRATEGGTLELEPAGGGVDGALARLLAVIYRSMVEGTWKRLKACLNDACQWAFYDASKNRSGTWCSMEVCGNRMKVRSHRERHRH